MLKTLTPEEAERIVKAYRVLSNIVRDNYSYTAEVYQDMARKYVQVIKEYPELLI